MAAGGGHVSVPEDLYSAELRKWKEVHTPVMQVDTSTSDYHTRVVEVLEVSLKDPERELKFSL